MKTLQDKHFLIIGATGNLGAATARRLKDEGAGLTLTGRNSEKLNALGEELSAPSLALDLLQTKDRAALAEGIDKVDGVVDAAGVAPLSPLKYIKDVDMEYCLLMNLQRPTAILRDLVKAGKLKTGGSIVWISSMAASLATPGYAIYAASKAGLEAAGRCLALELAPKSIRLNCIAPGMIESDMAGEVAEKISNEAMDRHFQKYPLGLGQARDVADVAVFLLSERARWITGTVLTLDGGYTLTKY